MCLGVFLLGFFGTLWASWTFWKSISFAILGKFSFFISSNKFSISCYSCSPSGTPMIWILECLRLFQSFLSLSLFSLILVSSFCSGWMFISSFCFKSLIWVPVSFPSLLVPCIFSFIYVCVAFISSFILQLSSISFVSVLITSVLDSASARLSVFSSLSSFSGVLICSFTWAIFLCLGAPFWVTISLTPWLLDFHANDFLAVLVVLCF